MEKLKQAHGNWVDGDRFWDREKDIELMVEKIDEGAHVLLTAQRRMGKTSLMREAKRRLEGRYICLFADFQKASSAEDAMVELSLALKPHEKLWARIRGLFANILIAVVERVEEMNVGELGVKLRAGLTSGNRSDKGDSLFSIMAGSEIPVLLLIDEAPVMVNRILKGGDYTVTPERKSEADRFMSWLRKNSQQHQGRIRIILSGSIGFEPVLRQAGLSAAINNFLPFALEPWDGPTAIGCLRALANEYGVVLKDNAEAEMIKMIGYCIPHHVQMFFTHVRDRCKRRGRMDFYPAEVAEVYADQMLGVRGHAELTHYEDRLKLVLGPEILPLALEMLTEAAVTGCLAPTAPSAIQTGYEFRETSVREATEEVLRVLEHDGYFKPGAGGYVFESRLLKDWWEKRYSALYVPALQRGV